MSDVSWWLMLLSFVLGAVITWLWVVRRATRQVARVAPPAGVTRGAGPTRFRRS